MMNFKGIFLSLFSFCLFISVSAQTYSGTGGPIDDTGVPTVFPLSISGLSPATLDGTFGLENICLNLTHTYDSDLRITLRAPDGTEVILSDQNGGDEDDYLNTCFDHTATQSITTGFAPFSGSFLPEQNLALINNGQNGNGTWELVIEDVYPFADMGDLIDWDITFGSDPAAPFEFTSSNLPIVVINTLGNPIVDEPKTMMRMGVINNGPGVRNFTSDPFNEYDGWIAIEIRGNTSASFDKKSYGFETRDSLGEDIDVSLLGLPEEEDWILHGPYSDKSHLRNVLIMKTAREAGQYASRTAFCEVIIDGDYRGLYVLMEKIKRDDNRLDIAKLKPTDLSGDELTGGYIFRIDKSTSFGWYSDYDIVSAPGVPLEFSYYTPDVDEIMPAQEAYIQAFVDSFEQSIASATYHHPSGKRYDEFINLRSFAQNFLFNELTRNVDAYRLSTFFYKKKDSNGGKVHAGPIWDYNLGFGNADYCDGDQTSGWMYYEFCDDGNPFWWANMLQDTVFQNMLQCEWQLLRSDVLHLDSIMAFMDSTAVLLEESTDRNFTRWPILGTYVWPNPFPYANTYLEAVTQMKDFIQSRITWMDANMPGNCWPVAPLSVQVTVDNHVSCNGETDGAATVIASGGNPGYTYLWPDNMIGSQVTGLEAGTYTVTIQDNYNLSGTVEVIIMEPDPLFSVISNMNPVQDSCNGEITVIPNGGTAPYAYQWGPATGGQSTATASGLCEGTYCVTVTDDNGCVTDNCGALIEVQVGIQDDLSSERITIWPNPSRGQFHVALRDIAFSKIEVFDLARRSVGYTRMPLSLEKDQLMIQLDAAPGIYFIRIENAERAWTKRISIW